MRALLAATLAVGLLVGCRQGRSSDEEKEKLAALPESAMGKLKVPRGEAPKPPGQALTEPPPLIEVKKEPGRPEDIVAGMRREQLLQVLGSCAERTHFFPGNRKGGLSVEVFQPKHGDCQKVLGQRHFFVAGDLLKSIEPGVHVAQKPGQLRRDESEGG